MRVASRGWLPRSLVLGRVGRRVLAGCFGLLVVILVATGGNAVFGLGGQSAEKPIRDWLSSAVYILVAVIVALRAARVRTNRVPWAIFCGVSEFVIERRTFSTQR